MDKQEIRSRMREKKRMLSTEFIQHESELVLRKLLDQACYQNTKSIYCYVSYNQEISTRELIQRALLDGKSVFVPKIIEKEMEFYQIQSICELTSGYQGILEPVGMAKANCLEALVIMPGLAFDVAGNRMGYGGGFYDRYLSRHANNNFYLVGLAYDFQVLQEIPHEAHDIQVNQILTPTNCILK